MTEFSLWQFFYHPALRAPTLGSMMMGLTSALIGVTTFVRRRSLLGEALAHGAYPGLMLATFLLALLGSSANSALLIGASLTALLGLLVIETVEKKFKINPDSALCLVLSLFLGGGVVCASRLQFAYPILYQEAQIFLYGQAATMNDSHLLFYGVFTLLVLSFLLLNFRHLQLVIFDQQFAKSMKVQTKRINAALFCLLILTLVMGMRSVGVVLVSGMVIAPAVGARQWTHNFSLLFVLSGFFGLLSGFFGNYLSVQLPVWIGGNPLVSLPTGPMILLFASALAFFSLLFAPERGVVSRWIRICQFRFQCVLENILKTFWKQGTEKPLTKKGILKWNPISIFTLHVVLAALKWEGWIREKQKTYQLTPDGIARASYLIRLHRLWELYLTSHLKIGEERVHRSAEEMEHILTPELEEKLTRLLQDPKKDPHKQPIPKGEEKQCME